MTISKKAHFRQHFKPNVGKDVEEFNKSQRERYLKGVRTHGTHKEVCLDLLDQSHAVLVGSLPLRKCRSWEVFHSVVNPAAL